MPVVFGLNPLYRKFAYTALVVIPGPLKACSQRPSRMKGKYWLTDGGWTAVLVPLFQLGLL